MLILSGRFFFVTFPDTFKAFGGNNGEDGGEYHEENRKDWCTINQDDEDGGEGDNKRENVENDGVCKTFVSAGKATNLGRKRSGKTVGVELHGLIINGVETLNRKVINGEKFHLPDQVNT